MAIEYKTFKTRNEWLAGRHNTIGGSDAGAILGLCKYRDNVKLWRIMMGIEEPEDISDVPYVKYGIEAEQYIRELFRLHHPDWAVGYEENNLWLNSDFPFAHASLDAWVETPDGKHGILEIKTAELSSKIKAAEWEDNRIPDTYYAQILHYFLVTGFDFAILCAELKTFRKDGSIEWRMIERRIDRSEVLDDIKELEIKERGFWWHLQDHTEPGLLLPI